MTSAIGEQRHEADGIGIAGDRIDKAHAIPFHARSRQDGRRYYGGRHARADGGVVLLIIDEGQEVQGVDAGQRQRQRRSLGTRPVVFVIVT